MENKVLLIEDSRTFGMIIQNRVHAVNGFQCEIATTFKEAKEKITEGEAFFIAVVDLNLPDASHDEVVDYVIDAGIPVIVFTSEFSDEIRDKMIAKRVVDYILKKDYQTLDYLVKLIERIHRNRSIKILVVDDSSVSRIHLGRMLETQKFQVIEAKNGIEALEKLEQNPETKLIITDYNMPEMDGFELIGQIRKRYRIDQLAIIGISAYGSGLLSIKFLKIGANDFINKPFVEEELHLRIKQNIEMLEYIETFQNLSNIDFLTQLHNRRYFFDVGKKLFENGIRQNLEITIGMIDVDDFKKINDIHGHDAGDMVLKHISTILTKNFRSADIVARYGGEEFCVLAINMEKSKAKQVFERVRRTIESSPLEYQDKTIHLSISIGVSNETFDRFEEKINHADKLLYEAKRSGKNIIVNR